MYVTCIRISKNKSKKKEQKSTPQGWPIATIDLHRGTVNQASLEIRVSAHAAENPPDDRHARLPRPFCFNANLAAPWGPLDSSSFFSSGIS